MKIGPLEITWGKTPARRPRRRSFGELSSGTTNIMADWLLNDNHINRELQSHVPRLVRMARSFEHTNAYMRQYLAHWQANVIGPHGMIFQSKVERANGNADRTKQTLIEDKYREFQESKDVLVTGDLCFRDFRAMEERCLVRDGNVFLRKIRNFSNGWNFAIQIIDPDYLAIDLNDTTRAGNRIQLGKEFDRWGRAVAYWFTAKSGADNVIRMNGRDYLRVPAAEMIHRFYKERSEQLIGYPLVTAAIEKLRHLEKYEESELVASRVAASATIAMQKTTPDEYTGDVEETDSTRSMELSPGSFLDLPMGYEAQLLNPTHPNGSYPEFRKGVLRGAASAFQMDYAHLGSDFSDANYSSMRQAWLSITDQYRCSQQLSIEQSERPIFEAWLEMQLVNGNIDLPIAQFDRWKRARWQPRGWKWVDPQKEVAAAAQALELGITSRRRILAELGIDIEELAEELRQDDEILGPIKNMERPNAGGNNDDELANDDSNSESSENDSAAA